MRAYECFILFYKLHTTLYSSFLVIRLGRSVPGPCLLAPASGNHNPEF